MVINVNSGLKNHISPQLSLKNCDQEFHSLSLSRAAPPLRTRP